MEKKGIFAKIDELYTNATKVIIGDMPLDGSPEAESKVKKNAHTEKKSLKEKFSTIKSKMLNLGKPNDEKSLLYDEVVKREKQETKEAKKTTKKVNPAKKVEKKLESKKTAPKSKATSTKKKTNTKVADSTSKTTKTVSKKVTSKKDEVKKAESKKSTPVKKVTAKKTETSKTTAKKMDPKKSSSKSTTTKDKSDKKTTSIKKTTAAPRGVKKAEKIALYTKDIKKHYGEVDEAFVAIIVKNLGPSVYKADAEMVTCSDPKELNRVRKSFLVKKLGIDASKGVLDAAIQDVCTELKGVRKKYRATFYYALAKKFKKESELN